jgi:GNAT superfamily N-acetyltransferase
VGSNCDITVHRATTDAHWHEATALLHDYVEWVRGWTGVDPVAEQPQLQAELGALADHYSTDDAAFYLAVWQALAVGAVAIRVQPDGSSELKRMFVRPVARGRGIADRLIEAAVDGATERRCHTVWLETLRVMAPAIAVYRRNGFTDSSTRRSTLISDAIVMERTLSVLSGARDGAPAGLTLTVRPDPRDGYGGPCGRGRDPGVPGRAAGGW